LIFSGDLVDGPTEENYRLVKSLLANLSFPVFIIPGNADNRTAMRTVFSEHDYWPQTGPMNFAIELNGKVRLIGFDVTVEGEIFGIATAEALQWLDAEFARQPHLPTLVMMHQHPFKTGIGPLDDLMCRNGEDLADLAGRSQGRISTIVCGHGHRTIFTTIRNMPAIMCPSLSTANPLALGGHEVPEVTDAPGLLVHHFHESGINSHVISLA
jgi:3',5'-cyclic AMP phosphodiesterase CpdA